MLAQTEIPTAAEIRSIIAKILTIAFDGPEQRWSNLVGHVAALSRSSIPHSNWAVQPRGSADEREIIHRAVAIVREAYPYVRR